MPTETLACPHGRDLYREACTMCRIDHEQYEKALVAVESLGRGVNGGRAAVTARAFGCEHAYLFNELATAVALSALLRTYNSLCPVDGTIFKDDPHPEHDGRLGCGTVVGALRTLATKREDDPLQAREFWLSRIYEPLS